MTLRGIKLVDEAKGFDNYILNTPVNEIYAWKLLKLRREMLLELCDKENFAGRGGLVDVYEKYQEHKVLQDEADWFGLTLQEAIRKQLVIERIKMEESVIPQKQMFREELFMQLRD